MFNIILLLYEMFLVRDHFVLVWSYKGYTNIDATILKC